MRPTNRARPRDLPSNPYTRRRSLALMFGGGAGFGTAAVIVVIVLVVLGALAVAVPSFLAEETVETTIVDKERVCDSTGSGSSTSVECKYLIFTEAGTFQLTDSIFAGRWSSSDAYGRIKRCHRYEITSYGWRLPFFSSYPNIKDAKDLGVDEGCEP